MAPTIVVHGPQGCGKTLNAEAMRRAFGCTSIQDCWNGVDHIMPGALVLTNMPPPYDRQPTRHEAMSFALASHLLGIIGA